MAKVDQAQGPLLGALMARGPLDQDFVKLVHRLIAQGRSHVVQACLSYWLLEQGTIEGGVVPNAGVLSPTLKLRARAELYAYASKSLPEPAYEETLRTEVVRLAYEQWEAAFRPAIPVTASVVANLKGDELNDRICIAALNCRDAVYKMEREYPQHFTIETAATGLKDHKFLNLVVLGEEGLEILCKVVVRAALEGFEDPNGVQHRLLHSPGKKTS